VDAGQTLPPQLGVRSAYVGVHKAAPVPVQRQPDLRLDEGVRVPQYEFAPILACVVTRESEIAGEGVVKPGQELRWGRIDTGAEAARRCRESVGLLRGTDAPPRASRK
jgi:hypothetical protein